VGVSASRGGVGCCKQALSEHKFSLTEVTSHNLKEHALPLERAHR
jgi:hypothetical protein